MSLIITLNKEPFEHLEKSVIKWRKLGAEFENVTKIFKTTFNYFESVVTLSNKCLFLIKRSFLSLFSSSCCLLALTKIIKGEIENAWNKWNTVTVLWDI